MTRSTAPLRPTTVLRAEGAIIGACAIATFVLLEGSLLLFLAVVLLPDVSIGAYLVSPRAGAIAYNAVHTYVGPAALLAAGVAWSVPLAIDVGLIWAGHVGLDRLFGLGLKYGDRAFRDTHLQRV